VVPEGARKMRVDRYLAQANPEISRTDFQRALDAGLVEVNGESATKKQLIAAGDRVLFELPAVESLAMGPIDLGLQPVYEDDDLIVVNKPAGLVTHPGAGKPEPTLAHGLHFLCKGKLSLLGGEDRPGIVHRLDRETSGLIVAAKTDEAYRALGESFRSRTIVKEYLALVTGVPKLFSGSIRKNIERNPAQRHKMRVCQGDHGREARTDWVAEARFRLGYSLLRCRIHTGRTHQIRVHLMSIGHAILGDRIYGYRPLADLPMEPKRVMLHAARLAFDHPASEEKLNLEAPPPEDFDPFLASPRVE
jgi:23S rRNA pseudouridine1911/1915/1917 synthase